MSFTSSFKTGETFKISLRKITRLSGKTPTWEADVKAFGCRPIARVGQAPGPASESLQGRNPRVVGEDGAAGAMGISPK
jgi:hypothetical protein